MSCIRKAMCDFCDARCPDFYEKKRVWEVTVYDSKVKHLVKKYFADEQDADEFVMQKCRGVHNETENMPVGFLNQSLEDTIDAS